MSEPRRDYRRPKTVKGPRRRYAVRGGKVVEITGEGSKEISKGFHIGRDLGRSWNGR